MLLKNKNAIITGASRGIGRSTAELFAKEGANLLLTYCNSKEEIQQVEKEIKELGVKCLVVRCDLASQEDILNLAQQTKDFFGKVDILVNNAGKIIRSKNATLDLKTWNDTLAINITGMWLIIDQMISLMSKNSSIVNISSFVAELGSQYVLPYGIAKAGVVNMTKAYAKQLAPYIRVNSVAPGNIDTDMTRAAGEEFLKSVAENTPLKRLGLPEEIAELILFLSSDKSSFITGTNINIDGGYLLTQ